MKGVGLKDILFGFTVIETNAYIGYKITDRLFKAGIPYKTMPPQNDTLIIKCTSGQRKIKTALGEDIEYKITVGGLPEYILRHRNRSGLLFGTIVCITMLILSSLLVWDIEVSGNQKLSDAYIENILTDYGLKKGVFRQSIDLNNLHQEVLLDNGCIGWLRVNFRGTVAMVEVIEYEGVDNENKIESGSNLVASKDALILSVETTNGTPAVIVGDTVRAGELLIGGISDSNLHGYNLKRAEGSVIGEVCDDFIIKIPLKYNEKTYTGVSFTEKSIEFLGKEIKLSKNSGNSIENYDIIKTVKRLELFDTVKLPIELHETTYNEFENKSYLLDKEQAEALAEAELGEYLTEVSDLGDIVSISTESTFDNDSVNLSCRVYRTEDICKRVQLSSVSSDYLTKGVLNGGHRN